MSLQLVERSRPRHSDIHTSPTFITAVECKYCGGNAPLAQMLRERDPRTESMVEIRLFECEDCEQHTVLELIGA